MPGGDFAQFIFLRFLGGGEGVGHGAEDEVFEHFDIFRVHNLGVDLDRGDRAVATGGGFHGAAAGGGFDFAFGQVFLDAGHFGLHLLGLFEKFS